MRRYESLKLWNEMDLAIFRRQHLTLRIGPQSDHRFRARDVNNKSDANEINSGIVQFQIQ